MTDSEQTELNHAVKDALHALFDLSQRLVETVEELERRVDAAHRYITAIEAESLLVIQGQNRRLDAIERGET